MSLRYILVDSENIKPRVKILASFLKDEESRVLIFANSQQQFPAEMSKFLQPYGPRVEYIVMSGGGRNALDFLIAFYIGKIISTCPESEIQIISGDKGFVPLISHVKKVYSKNIELRTLDNNDTLPGKVRRRVTLICAALKEEGAAWPASRTRLRDFIRRALPDCKLRDGQVVALMDFMFKKELISITDDEMLAYSQANIAEAAKGFFIFKTNTSAPLPLLSPEPPPLPDPNEEAVEKICAFLKKRASKRPKKFQTLVNNVKTQLALNSEEEALALLELMEKKKIITKQEGSTKVAYDIEKIEAAAL